MTKFMFILNLIGTAAWIWLGAMFNPMFWLIALFTGTVAYLYYLVLKSGN